MKSVATHRIGLPFALLADARSRAKSVGVTLHVRYALLLTILFAGVWAAWILELSPRAAFANAEAWQLVGRFFAAAASPALYSESEFGNLLLPGLIEALRATVVFAAAAMTLALVFGALLGVLASATWWRIVSEAVDARGFALRSIPKVVAPALYVAARALITFMRSIHELVWAILFLASLGLSNASAVIAIAIPYAGTLAKVFSELLDEAPRSSAEALRAAGASPLQTFALGIVPRVLPDVAAYSFYRFECALRSSVILGFFGYPTLGKLIAESFNELYFHETWSYLYALIILVALMEWWSGTLRRHLTVA